MAGMAQAVGTVGMTDGRQSRPRVVGGGLRRGGELAEASLDDLAWADAALFGTPTRFGNPASQLKAFIDTAGPLWAQGGLADKVYSAFTASNTAHRTVALGQPAAC
jgi:multimeric flavodoxin WrbA